MALTSGFNMKHLITMFICLLVITGGVYRYDMDNLSPIEKYTQYAAFDFGFGFGFGGTSGGGVPAGGDALILESGDNLLLESGDYFLME